MLLSERTDALTLFGFADLEPEMGGAPAGGGGAVSLTTARAPSIAALALAAKDGADADLLPALAGGDHVLRLAVALAEVRHLFGLMAGSGFRLKARTLESNPFVQSSHDWPQSAQ